MYSILKRSSPQTVFSYFAKIYFIAVTPTILLGTIATYFWIDKSPSIFFAGDSSIKFIWQVVATGFIVPFLESLVLVFPTVIAQDAIREKRLAALIGALPLILLHGLVRWNKPFVIAWFFYVQAFSYLELRESGTSAKVSFSFIFLIHSIFNTTLVMLSYL